LESRLDIIFHALSDPTRRAILRDIASGERTVGAIAKPYPISLAATSKHLKVLETRKPDPPGEARSFQIVRINPEPLRQPRSGLRSMRSSGTNV